MIDTNNVISISLAANPQGFSQPNVNSVALFTNEIPDNLDDYTIALNPGDVAINYGTDSDTYKMANAIFAQGPNPLTGSGRLVIIPMLAAVSATQGDFSTADISANLSALIAVSNGDLKVTLNGTALNLTGINFTKATTFADIATILQKKLPNAIVEAISTTGIKIISKKVGTASTVALAAVSGGSGTNLAGSGLLNAAGGTAVAGSNSSGETIVQAIARTANDVQYTGVFTNLQIEDAVYLATSTAVQAMDKMFIHQSVSSEDVAGIGTSIKTANNFRTKCLLYMAGLNNADCLADANLCKAAYVGRGFSVDFNGSDASITLNLKVLATIQPDSLINQTIFAACEEAGMDTYSNLGITSNSFGKNGLFFDDVYGDLWLKFDLKTSGLNFLAQTTGKIPQTEQGMDGLKGAYKESLRRAINNGLLASGLTWNSSNVFGNPDDLRRNITDAGFYIYSLPIAQQSQLKRTERDAPLVQIAAKRAGAIQRSVVFGTIEA